MSDRRVMEADVAIVGARVAGSVLAAMLGAQGRRVLLLDKAAPGSPTLSTHFFRGGGLGAVLDSLGLVDQVLAEGTPRLVRQWFYMGGAAEGAEAPAPEPGELGFCFSVRRETLDPLLAGRAAQEQSVEYLPGTTATGLIMDGDRAVGLDSVGSGGEFRVEARLVVGADGRRSLVARDVGAEAQEEEDGHRHLYYRYVKGWTAPDGAEPDAAEFSLMGDEMAYVFPSDGGWTCIAASVGQEQAGGLKGDLVAGFDELLDRHQALAPRLAACSESSRVLGGPTGTNFVRRPAGPGWLLVGDAGQHQDPWTGVGMDLAGRTAAAAARHIGEFLDGIVDEPTALAAWTAERDAIGRDTWRMTVEGSRNLSG